MQILSFALINLLGCIYNCPSCSKFIAENKFVNFFCSLDVHSLPIIDNIDTVE